jgi:predicted RNA-binding Zn-ribbon protein involved in translation (DUF1610 family)
MKEYEYTRIIYVNCKSCGKEFDENEITDPYVGIEENERGWDILSFKCPYCGEYTKSIRRG